ncbi:hypothetical protein PVNG_05441 [Plasmodium vivax North Korean]|uniref:VIR protein n=1 Tax=Plasmodium vivax North Korean TaxID=1035514 RepID=A0A0J9TMU2_PLAVI|nr:hypothetical protein PVNG_05441 [Plasmodium vivax North Korean]
MSYKPYLKRSKLNSLINRLNDTKYEFCHKSTSDIFRSVEITQKETLKNIVSSVVCGYNYLTIFVDETLTDLCKYLNLWLDEQKGKHVIDEPDVSKEDWQAVENLWERLKGEKNADHQCKRQHTEKTTSEYSKRIDLMSYCINRDYFKNLFHSSGVSESYNANICEVFSNYIHENYEKLIRDINCIDKKSDIKDYKYHISEDCTLYDIPRTFPKCKAHGPTFVENDNSKKNIIKCETTTEVKSARTESTGSLAGPAETYDSLGKQLDPYGDAAKHPETPDDPLKLPEADDHYAKHRELDLQLSSTDASLTDNGPSKPIYYAGLSVSGVFFTSTVLYKV